MSEVWRCDVTGNPVGTDTIMIGAPPCQCQGCRSSAIIKDQAERISGLEDVLEEKRDNINSLRALLSKANLIQG